MADEVIRLRTQSGGFIDVLYHDNGGGTWSPTAVSTTTPTAPALVATPCTIAQGQSESAEVNLGGRALVAIVTSVGIEATTTHVSIRHGVVSGTRYVRQSAGGTRQQFAISIVNRETFVEPSEAAALHYVPIVAETAAGVAVVQATAAREFVLLSRAI